MEVNGDTSHDASNLRWWTEHLKDSTVSPLTRDYPEPGQDISRPRIEAIETLRTPFNLQEYRKASNSLPKWREVVLAAVLVLISRLTGDEDICLGANHGPTSGQFILRTQVTSGHTFQSLLVQVVAAVDVAKNKSLPLRQLSSEMNTKTMFRFAAYETTIGTNEGSDNLDTTDLYLTYSASTDNMLNLTARYNQRLFSSIRVAGILAQVAKLMESALTDTNQQIGAISICPLDQEKLLPDPSSDLEWSSFRGAIHDIFEANAKRFPDRPCVVETKSVSSPERSFTYNQINEASNILAHHLVNSGVERSEVVMIYSYRGVDLVVAVMGTLKAGATFSVLDPAYPPDRQKIYLEVSKPRALVVIAKAAEDAGPLSEKVRLYIDENLELRTEIPALRLEDDGSLSGGLLDDKDVFNQVSQLRDHSPGVVVGPDSIPTLSFTSGSEGRPKGVRGRHYSLAFYFDWMAKTFKLSANDRFTMLSGIAHDPVQRDMFTPLFLGAQLLVPSKDDIQNERLAEWMQAYGATVTHLTPAMGQILVGGATARFEKLHHAFFVGDILIKRDCRSLQNLAPNVFIVNMYGTTETQRAVSYYEIPSFNSREGFLDSMKDVIPAGRGMHNVQLLVVNRFDASQLCAVGELGEIYVRASGLAEEYLGTPELTEKKFVRNWFVGSEAGLETDRRRFETLKAQPWAKYYLGPRDRLYRSGDLGRYTPSGNVECSGRADDQVKIRGFRIELGEIDTHLSQHPLIRENITLVRRDKFEEQTLVSYLVPQVKAWESFLAAKNLEDQPDDGSFSSRFQRFQLLRQDVQEYLRTKLPAYAVPSLIVPMKRMPLNPNGKIDKPKLPFPDTAMFAAARRRKSSMMTQLSETELALAHIWAKLIPGLIPRSVKPSDSFFDYGGNSLSAQQLPFLIRRSKGIVISISRIYDRPTLAAMAGYIDSQSDDDADQSSSGHHTAVDGLATDDANASRVRSYTDDAEVLKSELPPRFPELPTLRKKSGLGVLLTGATGFLGAYILKDILTRKELVSKVFALVRAKDYIQAMSRLQNTCKAYGVWNDDWVDRFECLVGDLAQPHFGLADKQWQELGHKVDVVVHNGANVHWIQPYAALKGPNVMGTIQAICLCATGRAKQFVFVSSTAVLDADAFVHKSEASINAGGEGISESDDLFDSRSNLSTGYGQSKWVSEYLVREAAQRGLSGWIVRPGYVLGDSKSGVTNTDDFLIRMLKGCIQLGSRPNINNSVNMVPVDHVARVVAACALNKVAKGIPVAHVTAHPRLRMNQFLAVLQTYGYDVPVVDYIPWTRALEDYVGQSASGDQFALMSLFTFVMNDLPSNTRAPDLDDTNAEAVLYEDSKFTGEDVSEGSAVTKNNIGLYLAYLVSVGFLPPPGLERHVNGVTKALPKLKVSKEQKHHLLKVGGRGTLV